MVMQDLERNARLERVVGHHRGTLPGPMLLVVAGIHGNEPAGVLAARRCLARLERDDADLHGDFVVLTGNIAALRRGVRFIDHDLNRGWTEDRLALPMGPTSEDCEQRELLDAIDAVTRTARGPVSFVDLHSTSAPGTPFTMARNEPMHRDFALRFPLPIILGLLELVDSTLLEHMRRRGYRTLGVEAGQNEDPSSVDHHESLLELALVETGVAPAPERATVARHRARLEAARGDLPHLMEVGHRHAITADDAFRMQPGYTNVQRVRAGEILAYDRHGPIHAADDGVLMLPLYQAQGDDGFFLGREVPAGEFAVVQP